MSKLEDILNKNWDQGFQAHRATTVPQNRIDEREFRSKSVDEAAQQILDLCLGCVGEGREWSDEKYAEYANGGVKKHRKWYSYIKDTIYTQSEVDKQIDEYRAETRQRLKEALSVVK